MGSEKMTNKPTKKKAKGEIPVTYIRIDCVEDTYYTREPRDDDNWDAGEQATDRTISDDFQIVASEGYRDLVTDIEIEPDRDYYVVYTEWGSGSSFGFSDNCHITFHELYDSAEKAQLAVKQLNTPIPQPKKGARRRWWNHDEYEITLNNGKKIPVYASWVEYFESLTGHNYKSVRLRK